MDLPPVDTASNVPAEVPGNVDKHAGWVMRWVQDKAKFAAPFARAAYVVSWCGAVLCNGAANAFKGIAEGLDKASVG